MTVELASAYPQESPAGLSPSIPSMMFPTLHSILHVQPKSAIEQDDIEQDDIEQYDIEQDDIEQDDFVKLATAVDPHIEATGSLAGLIIEVPALPGWQS